MVNAATGFTVQSVSLTNILQPGQSASQTQWLINVVANGGGQSLVISDTLSNATLAAQCGAQCKGETPASSLQITAQENPETEIFPIGSTLSPKLKSYTSTVLFGSLSVTGFLKDVYNATAAPWCQPTYNNYPYSNEWDYNVTTKPNGVLSSVVGSVTVVRICIYSSTVGAVSAIAPNPYRQFSTTLTFNAGGNQKTLTISNANQSGTSSTPDGAVQVNWPGSLDTLNPPLSSQPDVAVNNYQRNPWMIGSSSAFSQYQVDSQTTSTVLNPQNIQFDTYTNSSMGSVGCTGIARTLSPYAYNYTSQSLNNVANCLSNRVQSDYSVNNNDVTQLLAGGYQIGNNPTQQVSYNNQPSFSVSTSTYFTSNPELDLRLSGVFLGVLIPVGKPKILSAKVLPISSGGNGTISLQVTNIGSGLGSFYISLTNCSGITLPTSSKYTINPGNTSQISIGITATGANQVVSETCTITVSDSNGGGSDSSPINVKIQPPNQCTPNTNVIQGSSICPCVNQTGVWKVDTTNCQTCKYGVVANAQGTYACATPPTTVGAQTTAPSQNPTYAPTWQSIGHKDVVLITATSQFTTDSRYQSALSSYESTLSSKGLSFVYFDLSSNNASNLLGFIPNLNDWHSVKMAINKIEYQTNPTYVVILGNVNIIPMPSVYTSVPFDTPLMHPTANLSSIPTDDPYASLTNSTIPSVVLARIPGSSADEIATLLSNGVKKHSSTNFKLGIIGDGVQGGDDSFVRSDTNWFSQVTTGLTCSANSDCLYAPPYCSTGINCNSSSALQNNIASVYGVQVYDCHGDGFTCAGSIQPIIISSMFGGVPPQLNTTPVIMIAACFDGSIDNSLLGSVGVKTLATDMLDNGASVYIGNTKEGYGGITPAEEAFIYNKFKNGEPIGKAFLDMKVNYLTHPYNPYQEGTAHEQQLYGDPTISVGG